MKLIKSFLLLAVCLGANNFLFAQAEPAIATKAIEFKPAVAPDSKPNPAIISKQQNPAELKTADSKNNIQAATKEEMPKPQALPLKNTTSSSTASVDIIFPNTPLPKPIISDAATGPATTTAPKQVPVKNQSAVSQSKQQSN